MTPNSAKNDQTYAQIIHDMSSPITVLELLVKRFDYADQNDLNLLKQAVTRIKSICKDNKNSTTSNNKLSLKDIHLSIEQIVQEKLIEYQNYPEVKIISQTSLNSKGFVKISKCKIERILSNLINNSFESITESGIVQVKAWISNCHLFIKIQDNGIGVSEDQMAYIFEQGYSFNKSNHSGLGLWNAKNEIEQSNGQLHFTSIKDQGSSVTISLPIY